MGIHLYHERLASGEKTCPKCKINKSLSLFSNATKNKDGKQTKCKECDKAYEIEHKEKIAARNKDWRLKNKAKLQIKQKIYRITHKDQIDQYRKDNKEHIAARKIKYINATRKVRNAKTMEWYYRNKPDYIKRQMAYVKRREEANPELAIRRKLRTSILVAVKRNGSKKPSSTVSILGADIKTVRLHLERLFQPGMAWENHGTGKHKWNIDHIIPIASAKNLEEVIALCHYSNLQPLWSIENIIKGRKYYLFNLK